MVYSCSSLLAANFPQAQARSEDGGLPGARARAPEPRGDRGAPRQRALRHRDVADGRRGRPGLQRPHRSRSLDGMVQPSIGWNNAMNFSHFWNGLYMFIPPIDLFMGVSRKMGVVP